MAIVKMLTAAVTSGLLALALSRAMGLNASRLWLRSLQATLYGPLAPWTFLFAFVLAVCCFRAIVLRYRKISGFPWLASLGFAAAAVIAVIALNALASR